MKNYYACHYGVKIRLKMLIYKYKLRYFAEFRLVLAALITFFKNLSGGFVERIQYVRKNSFDQQTR